jgi:hypothetical protein
LFPFIHIFRLKFSPTKIKKRWEIPLLSPPKFGNHFKKPDKSLLAQDFCFERKEEKKGDYLPPTIIF